MIIPWKCCRISGRCLMMWHWPSPFADEHFPLPTVAKLSLLNVVSSTSGNDRIEKCRNIKTGVGHELHSTLAHLFINTLVSHLSGYKQLSGARMVPFFSFWLFSLGVTTADQISSISLIISSTSMTLSLQLHCYVCLTFSHMYSVLLLLSFMPRFWCYNMMV